MQREMGLQAAQHGDGRAQHTDSGAGAALDGNVGKDRAVARAAAAEGAGVTRESDHRRADQRLGGGETGVAQDVGGSEAVGGIDQKIGAGDQCLCVLRRQALGHGVDGDPRVEAPQRRRRCLRLELADIGHGVERLAMKVGLLDPVMVDDGEPADARAGQVLQHRTPQPAGADHHDGRGGEPRLTGGADLGKHHLAGVAFAHGLAPTDLSRVAATHALVWAMGSR